MVAHKIKKIIFNQHAKWFECLTNHNCCYYGCFNRSIYDKEWNGMGLGSHFFHIVFLLMMME